MDIRSSREFAVTRDALFAAFADPDRLATWRGPAGAENAFETFELRVGGAWRFVMRVPGGEACAMTNRFVGVAPPSRVVVLHEHAGHDLELRIDFEALDPSRSRLRWRMRLASPDEAALVRDAVLAANEQRFDRLAAALAKSRRAR